MDMRVEVDLADILGELEEIDQNIGRSVKPAAYFAARLVRDEAIIQAPMSEKAHIFRSETLNKKTGKYFFNGQEYLYRPGDLKKSIYLAQSKEEGIDGQRAVYKGTWRTKPNYGAELMAVPYAYWIEFGNARMPAHPFVRKAYDMRHKEAEQLMEKTIREYIHAKDNH